MKIRLIVASIMLSFVFMLSACGDSSGATSDQSEVDVTTATVTTAENTTKSTDVSKSTEKATVAQTEPQYEAPIVTEAFGGTNSENYEPQSTVCTVYVDSKSYECNVGDTITYVYNLKTPDALEDFQASLSYDSNMLKLIDTGAESMFPVAGGIVIYNTALQNSVKFNAVNIEGMDFTKGGQLVRFDFKVLDSGNTAISTTVEIMDSVKSEPYVDNFKILGDIEYSEEII